MDRKRTFRLFRERNTIHKNYPARKKALLDQVSHISCASGGSVNYGSISLKRLLSVVMQATRTRLPSIRAK